ncbi:MAG: alkaline phosphatase family protein [Pirellulales bacterium]|jgi:predicted AlkP superfamily pyrophosphatase or phosphodiesterase|nr:alkaline phosphatase family protein [Pirellulales bacterium]
MTKPVVVINVVGLSPAHLGRHTPHISALAQEGFACPLGTVLPAVTCTAQSTLLTGLLPRQHGIVANGWYERELAEVVFWKQSNRLVQGERIYQAARRRDPAYTTAKLFWWFNMYAPVQWSITPRPSYPADGRKLFDIYTQPESLRDEIQSHLGVFPLQHFWGPAADIRSTRWIVEAALEVQRRFRPTLMLVYLPHLDYNLQRFGPEFAGLHRDLKLVDAEAGRLITAARERGAEVVVHSEYAITSVSRPVHVNRMLREHGLLRVRRETLGWETLDAGASRAFAVADHQVAHIYVADPEDVAEVAALLERMPGIERVLHRDEQAAEGLDHPRGGELVAVAAPDAWFTYYFWLDDAFAPDYARTVDIHRKPGYDPAELCFDPALHWPRLRVAWRMLQKKLGFRYYMDVIGLDASVVRGSHGRLPEPGREQTDGPVLVCSARHVARDALRMCEFKELILTLHALP